MPAVPPSIESMNIFNHRYVVHALQSAKIVSAGRILNCHYRGRDCHGAWLHAMARWRGPFRADFHATFTKAIAFLFGPTAVFNTNALSSV